MENPLTKTDSLKMVPITAGLYAKKQAQKEEGQS